MFPEFQFWFSFAKFYSGMDERVKSDRWPDAPSSQNQSRCASLVFVVLAYPVVVSVSHPLSSIREGSADAVEPLATGRFAGTHLHQAHAVVLLLSRPASAASPAAAEPDLLMQENHLDQNLAMSVQ